MATEPDLSSPGIDRSSSSHHVKDTKASLSTSEIEVYGADEETLVRLFQSKIKYALAENGYDDFARTKVCELIERNMISCGIALNRQSGTDHSIQADLLQPQLEDLMASGFNVNSNEPVLMILVDSNDLTSPDIVRAIREATRAVIQTTFHIFPVRVYVACHTSSQTHAQNLRRGFSLAILNVVNTDIGGPGMIQLLDDFAASSIWNQMVVSTEAWNRSEMHWRNESQWMTHPGIDMTHKEHEVPDLYSSGAAQSTHEPVIVASMQDSISESKIQTDELVLDHLLDHVNDEHSVEEVSMMLEHPAMTELLAREVSRPSIQHPTWNHSSRSDSLLDLVRTQASEHRTAESASDLDETSNDDQDLQATPDSHRDGQPNLA